MRRTLLVCALVALGQIACGGPFLVIPGGELSGEVVDERVEDWSFLEDGIFELETRPGDPYSVQLNYFVRDGQLYIDPAEGRTWLENIRADPNVRARFGDRIYPLRAELAGRPGELEGFDADRYVYRLVPRD